MARLWVFALFSVIGAGCGPATTQSAPLPPQQVTPPPRQKIPPQQKLEPPEPPPKLVCAAELNKALVDGRGLYWIVNDGQSKRCLQSRHSMFRSGVSGALIAKGKTAGDRWVTWVKRVSIHLSTKHRGNRLQLFWTGADTLPKVADCGRFAGSLGGLGFGTSGPLPKCGAEMTVRNCDGSSLRFDRGAIYLNKKACQAALRNGAVALPLGKCARTIAMEYAAARVGPLFSRNITEGAMRLVGLLNSRKHLYLLGPKGENPPCRKWRIKPDAKQITSSTWTRKFRRKGRNVTDSYQVHFKGVELSLVKTQTIQPLRGQAIEVGHGGISGSCRRLTAAGRGYFEFQRGITLFFSRANCMRARRKSRSRP